MTTTDPPVRTHLDIPYIRIGEVPGEDRRAALRRWMAGQTRMLVDGLEPQDAVYLWDYERWRDGRPVVD